MVWKTGTPKTKKKYNAFIQKFIQKVHSNLFPVIKVSYSPLLHCAFCRPGQLKQRARGHISINGWKCYYSTLCNYILCHKWSISHSAMHCCCNSTWITWCHTSGSSRTVFLTLSLISSRFTAYTMGPKSFCSRILIIVPHRFQEI